MNERAARCPCDLGGPYEACCGRYHRGEEPPDATSLMRSRYAAFVKRDVDYLVRTLHPDHALRAEGEEAARRSLRSHFAEGLAYRKLEILDAAPPDADGISLVLFRVHVARRGKDVSFAELSSFAHAGTGLRYVSGRTFALRDVPRESRISTLP